MSRLKKIKSHFHVASVRYAAMKSIDPQLDLGFGLTLEQYGTDIKNFLNDLNAYNTALSLLDSQRHALLLKEKNLRDKTTRMLSGVATRFGRSSHEYRLAGGSYSTSRKSPSKPVEGKE